MLRVLGVGDNVVDVYLHRNLMYPGGNTMNFCAYARKLGHNVGYIGVFGTDRAAEHIIGTAKHLGIDLSRIRQYPGENGWAKVELIDGDRTFMGSNKGGVSKEHPIVLNENDLEYIRGYELVHTSCFSYLGKEEISKIAASGVRVSYDFSTNLDLEQMAEICPDIFLTVGSCGHMPETEVSELAKRIHDLGSDMVLLSMGMRGAFLFDGQNLYHQPAGKEKAIDSMGAGDSFLTAFSTSYLSYVRQDVDYESAIIQSLQKAADFATEICMIDGAFGFGTEYEKQPDRDSEIKGGVK